MDTTMKRTIFIFLATLLFFGFAFHLSQEKSYGALKDFGRKTKKEQRKNRNSNRVKSSKSNSDSSDAVDGVFGCIGIIFDIFSTRANNNDNEPRFDVYGNSIPKKHRDRAGIGCTMSLMGEPADVLQYTKHPYSNTDISNFIVHIDDYNNDNRDETKPELENEVSPFFFAFTFGGQYAYSNGWGMYAALSGSLLGMMGPEAYFFRYEQDGFWVHTYAAGFNFPLVQIGGFYLEFILQYAGISGNYLEDSRTKRFVLSGANIGVKMRIFPFQPVVLTGEYGFQIYESIQYHLVMGSLGIIIYKFEFFGGYRQLESKDTKIGGIIFGLRIWL